jgi:hypothetical protein
VPRLTNNDYLAQRDFLVTIWQYQRGVFAALQYHEQLEIHAFYDPGADLTPEEAIHHRQQATADHPSLPNRVGKLYPRLVAEAARILGNHVRPKPPPAKTKSGAYRGGARQRIRIAAVAKRQADIDGRKVTEVLLEMARESERRLRDGEKAA